LAENKINKNALKAKLQQKMVIKTICKDVVETIGWELMEIMVKAENSMTCLTFQHKLFQGIWFLNGDWKNQWWSKDKLVTIE